MPMYSDSAPLSREGEKVENIKRSTPLYVCAHIKNKYINLETTKLSSE